MKRSRVFRGDRGRYLLRLAHLMSPDDYEAGEKPGVDQLKAMTRKSQEDIEPGEDGARF